MSDTIFLLMSDIISHITDMSTIYMSVNKILIEKCKISGDILLNQYIKYVQWYIFKKIET